MRVYGMECYILYNNRMGCLCPEQKRGQREDQLPPSARVMNVRPQGTQLIHHTSAGLSPSSLPPSRVSLSVDSPKTRIIISQMRQEDEREIEAYGMDSPTYVKISLICRECEGLCRVAYSRPNIRIGEESCPRCERCEWELIGVQANAVVFMDGVQVDREYSSTPKEIRVVQSTDRHYGCLLRHTQSRYAVS